MVRGVYNGVQDRLLLINQCMSPRPDLPSFTGQSELSTHSIDGHESEVSHRYINNS
jgi:hypothetical protein